MTHFLKAPLVDWTNRVFPLILSDVVGARLLVGMILRERHTFAAQERFNGTWRA